MKPVFMQPALMTGPEEEGCFGDEAEANGLMEGRAHFRVHDQCQWAIFRQPLSLSKAQLNAEVSATAR